MSSSTGGSRVCSSTGSILPKARGADSPHNSADGGGSSVHLETGEAIAVTPTSWTSPFFVWRLSECSGHLQRIYEGVENPSHYVLPVRGGGADIVTREGNDFVKNVVDDIPFRRDLSLLVVGETGSGKTTTLKIFATQLLADPNEPRVVFDYKEDWRKFFGG